MIRQLDYKPTGVGSNLFEGKKCLLHLHPRMSLTKYVYQSHNIVFVIIIIITFVNY